MSLIDIYDIEQFVNLHTYTGISKDGNNKVTVFEISERKNEIKEYITYLKSLNGMIGFNNIAYDYPMLHYILINKNNLINLSSNEINLLLYEQSQSIINTEWSSISDWEVIIPQLDLFKLHHFNNKAKSASLKDIAINIKHDKIQDLPYKYDHVVKLNEIDNIIKYNLNDVLITEKLYKLSTDKIELRKTLSSQFNINITNADDVKVGAELFLHFIAEKTKKDKKDLRKLRTYRNSISLSECILSNIKHTEKQFVDYISELKSKTVTETKNSIEKSILYKGFKYDFGGGGIHGCTYPGIYIPNKNELIYSSDVISYYPNLSIKNKFEPLHFKNVFCNIYEWLFNERTKIPKSDPRNGAYKLSLNGTFGKSNDVYSFFYDPKFTLQITINGQLLLTQLSVELQNQGFKLLMINTDGFEFIIPKDKENLYLDICKKWETLTGFSLEHGNYQKMIIRDVNNYSAQDLKGKIKHKGAFEIIKDLHKDQSFLIVQKALEKYFFDNIPVEKTIKSSTEIYDFCGRFKATHGWIPYIGTINGNKIPLQKTNRYYISKSGGTFYKCHNDGREQVIESGWGVSIFNDYEYKTWDDYKINYQYYINECMKIIRVVQPEQLNLF